MRWKFGSKWKLRVNLKMIGTREMEFQLKVRNAEMPMSLYVYLVADVMLNGMMGSLKYMRVLLVKIRCGAGVTADSLWGLLNVAKKDCVDEISRLGMHVTADRGGDVEITVAGKEALSRLRDGVVNALKSLVVTRDEEVVEVMDCCAYFEQNPAEKAMHVAVEPIICVHLEGEGVEEVGAADAAS